MKKNTISKRGLNKSIDKAVAENYNNYKGLEIALKEVAKRYGMTYRALKDWMADRI